jgi:hypothetical protein
MKVLHAESTPTLKFKAIDLREASFKKKFLEAPGKYLAFQTDDLNFGSGKVIMGTCPMTDTHPETGEPFTVTFKVTFSSRQKGLSFKFEDLGAKFDVASGYQHERATVKYRSIQFSNDAITMGHQFVEGNFAPAVFSMITKMAMKMQLDEARGGFANRTGAFRFTPVSGGRGGNARSRVYAIVGFRLAREGFGLFVDSENTKFLLKPFVDLCLQKGYISHKGVPIESSTQEN